MSTPTEKSVPIDNLLRVITGRDRKSTIHANKCVMCGGEANEFRDAISRKEYSISGMCQGCQDKVFG